MNLLSDKNGLELLWQHLLRLCSFNLHVLHRNVTFVLTYNSWTYQLYLFINVIIMSLEAFVFQKQFDIKRSHLQEPFAERKFITFGQVFAKAMQLIGALYKLNDNSEI